MNNLQSLHSHTIFSDGLLNHLQVLDEAEKSGISVIAFTDHDVLPDQKIINQLRKKNHPVKWILGVELTCGEVEMFHIVGLFIDPKNIALQNHCQKILKQRRKRAKDTISHLQNLGFDISFKEASSFAKGPSIVWPHIVSALLAKQQNHQLMEKYREKAAQLGKKNSNLELKYQAMIDQGSNQYPYRLFLREDSFFPPHHQKSDYPNLDRTVSLIRGAGGLAVIAHYSTIREKVSLLDIEKLLKQGRIDGLEVVFGFWAYGTVEEKDIEQDRQAIKKLVKKYNKVAAGGGDFHKREDFQKYTEAKWYSRDSIGLFEKIIQKYPQFDKI
ncbi:PHP domain-containing protein [Candidatus Daviesbacteria bacterium]|nr:PHP domain-containing protein [Candidatus Daviesbacteria bacterium]